MKYLALLLIFINSFSSFSQEEYNEAQMSKPILQLTKQIARENVLMSSAIGGAGMRPEQYNRFEKLKNKATFQELKILTNHPNGVVRCYALEALLDNKENSDTIFSIVKKHLNDDEVIETFFGCIMSNELVSDIFQSYARRSLNYDNEKGVLNEKQIKELDSLLIYSGNKKSWYRYRAIEKLPAVKENYKAIKHIAENEKSSEVLIKLSEYRKKEDLNYFLSLYDYLHENEELGTYYKIAANYNANPSFFPILKKNLEQAMNTTHFYREWIELYDAIASYKNQESLQLLYMPFTQVIDENIQRYHLEYLQSAVDNHRDSLYNDILWKLWQEYNLINNDDYYYLNKLNPQKAYELSFNGFNEGFEFSPNSDLKKIFLENIKQKDRDKADSIIIEGIQKANVHEIGLFLSQTNKETKFIEPLFERLKTEDNTHNYLAIIETLTEYKNKEINQRILETRKTNPNLNEGWGSDKLDILLEENNIH